MESQIPQQPLSPHKAKKVHVVTQEPVSADLPLELQNKMTEKIESEVEEALGDAGRRKDYRDALKRHGIDMDFVVENLKNIVMAGEKDGDKIKALQVIAKSLGVDKSSSKEEEEDKGETWEDALVEDAKNNGIEEIGDYDVVEPVIPKAAKKKRDEENRMGKSIYDA